VRAVLSTLGWALLDALAGIAVFGLILVVCVAVGN
jgi:hypothetical protein